MPLPMPTSTPPIPNIPSTYPAIIKQTAGIVDGTPTDITSTQFSDKIMITITQGGRLAQWVNCYPVSTSANKSLMRSFHRFMYHLMHLIPALLNSTSPLALMKTIFCQWHIFPQRHCSEVLHLRGRRWVNCMLHKLPAPFSQGTRMRRELYWLVSV